jgi:hypothetical protein
MEKFVIEILAEHIDWKELVEEINNAIKDDTTDISSIEISYSEECKEEI